VQKAAQRGQIVYLTREAHKRLIPDEKPEKLGRRPWLVIQGDYANEVSPYTIVAVVTKARTTRSQGANVFLPKGLGLVNEDSTADCASIYTVRKQEDVQNVFDGNYYGVGKVMSEVDNALRLAMDLDPDDFYKK
jgi:mRNA-degrading endonuclease toxin of MazEF toxin-antitoxin module